MTTNTDGDLFTSLFAVIIPCKEFVCQLNPLNVLPKFAMHLMLICTNTVVSISTLVGGSLCCAVINKYRREREWLYRRPLPSRFPALTACTHCISISCLIVVQSGDLLNIVTHGKLGLIASRKIICRDLFTCSRNPVA